MDFKIVRNRPIISKCDICHHTIKDRIRSTDLNVKEESAGVYKIKICETCLYKLPSSLVADVLSPKLNMDHQFGNRIFSALKVSKYRDMNQGCVALIVTKNKNDTYKFLKFKNYESALNHDEYVDSIYVNGRRMLKK